MKSSSLLRTALVTAVVVSLAAIPAAAQSVSDTPAPAAATVETPKQAPSLVTTEAARVGIARSQTAATADALTAAPMNETTRWIVIIAVGILAAFLIMAVVD